MLEDLEELGTCLVTGASGFIGRRLVYALENQGANVLGLSRSGKSDSLKNIFLGDIRHPGDCEQAMKGVQSVFHLAGKAHALSESKKDISAYEDINVIGTRNLLEAAEKNKVTRFVFFSSVKAMGEGDIRCLDESDVPEPTTPYGRSKLAAENLVLHGNYVPKPAILRLAMVYGPGNKGNIVRMIRAIARGTFPPIPETHNRRSMIHVDDVARAAILVAKHPLASRNCYIITDGCQYSTRQIHDWICQAVGRDIPKWEIPLAVLEAAAWIGDLVGRTVGRRIPMDSDVLDKLTGSACYRSDKIRNALGFCPQYNLRQILPAIVEDTLQTRSVP